jgi:uncharacterized protein YndB with AHSA1/START domain
MATETAVKPSLTIKRRFDATPAKVYAAWTDPEKIKRWFGPPKTISVVSTFETRPGGKFMILSTVEGGEEFHVSGVVKEAIPNERVVYSWAWRGTPDRVSQVTVDFKADGGGTLLTLTHEQFFDDAVRDRHNQGWEAAFAKLETYLGQA